MLTYFDLVVNRLTEGNSPNQALKSLCVEVNVLTLTLHFSLFCCLFICFITLICLFILGFTSCLCYKHARLLDFLFSLFFYSKFLHTHTVGMHTHTLCMHMHTHDQKI